MENDVTVVDLGHDDVDGQECKDGRSRTWMALLYEDNEDMAHVLNERIKELDWDYAGRIHDQEGKPHHHVVILFKDGRKAADVAKDLGLGTRWLRAWDRKKKALRYLCHRDNPEKFQYDTDGIYGTIAEKAVAACAKSDALSEAQAVQEILKIIDEFDALLSYSVALRLMAEKGCFSVFRRMGVFGTRLIDEHNYYIAERASKQKQHDDMLTAYHESLKS